jgi:hypothetical protein
MAYRKLTKAQRKDRDRIEAWLKREPFRENSRSKPEIPDLQIDNVIETYVPPDISGAGQFFTPPDMAAQVWANAPVYLSPETKILDPCGGIGNLFYPVHEHFKNGVKTTVDVWELERECTEIGKRFYPWFNWRWEIPFERMDEIEGQYDAVIMNPPFGTKRGMYVAQENSEAGFNRSEHLFLELAIKALKPGRQLMAIAPYNFISGLPKKGAKWFEEHADLDWQIHLSGEFRFTGVQVDLFCISRLRDPEPEPEAIPEPVEIMSPAYPYQLSLF